jgi:hypothetical protein
VSIAGIVAVLVVAGCGGRSLPPPDVVARIENRDLPYVHFELYLEANSVSSAAGLSSEVLSRLFDRYLDEQILSMLAAERGFGSDGIASAAEVRAMIEAELAPGTSEQEIERYYRAHLEEFEQQERVLLRQILVGERRSAEEALAELRSGASFDEVVRRHSQGPGAERGGFQGELARSDLPARFAEVIFELADGEVSEVVEADYGFHLFQVVERRPAETLELAEVRAEIERRLRRELAAQAEARLVEQARSRYNAEVYERNLPFNYVGRY